MASPTTGATPGPISGMPAFTGTLSGLELIPIAVPPFGVVGSNRALPVVTLATAIIGNFPPQTANTVFAGPTSGAGTAAPIFRNLVLADIPGGTSGFPLVGNNATSAPSYQLLTVPGGGTGTSTLTQNGILYGNGASVVGITNAPATGQILAANNGTAVWSAAAAIGTSLQVPLIIGGVNANSTLTFESTSGAGSTDAIIFNTGSQTQAMRITSAQEVLIGPQSTGFTNGLLDVNYNTSTPVGPPSGIDAIRVTGANGLSPGFVADAFGSNPGILALRNASGTLQAPTPTSINQNLGLLEFYGFDGTNYGLGAQILVQAAATFNATTHPGFIAFDTTPGATTTITEAMRLQASGGLSIGTTTDPNTGALLVKNSVSAPIHTGSAATTQFTNAANIGVTVNGVGNVGINTLTPQSQLHVHLAADQNMIPVLGTTEDVPDGIAIASLNDAINAFKSFEIHGSTTVIRGDTTIRFLFNNATAIPAQIQSGLALGTTTDPGFGGFINTGTATIGGLLSVAGAANITGTTTISNFADATSLAVGTTTNPGTGAFIVTGTATVGGLLSVAGAANITGTTTITNYANASSLALGTTTNPGAGGLIITGTGTIGGPLSASSIVSGTTTDVAVGLIQATRGVTAMQGVALVNGGTTGGYNFFSLASLGLFAGTGVPTITAATSALYLRNDAVSSTTRVYINTNGGSTWVGLTATA